ncbi:MAG: 16S rRNA (cytosine(967)-C(5))-methyltransferase RsmB [Clostridia bacterium]|nr:16S rRNA (cytosine(967)-C(5))-methyltransferase RsmB [Clostridia bacterium]
MVDVRRIALRLLDAWERDDTYLNLALNSPATASLSREERGFLTALLYGTVERKITLDYLIGRVAARSDLDPRTRNILRLGFYQLFYMEIPAHAAVDLTVSLGEGRGEKGFVNGVLRASLRQFTTPDGRMVLPLPDRARGLARYLSIAYSFPADLVRHFLGLLGDCETEKLLAAFHTESPLTVAVNTLQTTREALAARFAEAGIEVRPTRYSSVGLTLVSAPPVAAIPGFSDGLFFVQDEAAQLASAILSPAPGSTVADVCACPGGKSFAAAIAMGDRGKVYAFDLHESKLPLISEGAGRLGLSSVSVACRDGLDPDPALFQRCDRVICDVPCSGLGVLGKKPDLRYRALERADELPALQTALLSASSKYVAPGGRLLYSTCTLNPRENEQVVSAFLETAPSFSRAPFSVGELSASEGEITLYPHIHDTDGFYYALLERSPD